MKISEINEKLQKLRGHGLEFFEMKSKDAKDLLPGDKVYYAPFDIWKHGLYETVVVKVDKRGSIRTENGLIFSTSYDIAATSKRIEEYGDSYLHLYYPEECLKEMEKKILEIAESEKGYNKLRLSTLVSNLSASDDVELINKLLSFFPDTK